MTVEDELLDPPLGPTWGGDLESPCLPEHTALARRAWCSACSEWCTPSVSCMRCSEAANRRRVRDVAAEEPDERARRVAQMIVDVTDLAAELRGDSPSSADDWGAITTLEASLYDLHAAMAYLSISGERRRETTTGGPTDGHEGGPGTGPRHRIR